VSFSQFLSRVIVQPARKGKLLQTVAALPTFYAQWRRYTATSVERVRVDDWFPCLDDATRTTPFDPHYFYQSAWVAAHIARAQPRRHVDVGSQIDLIAPLSGFVDVEFVDIRPLKASLPRLKSTRGTVLNLPYVNQSIESLSCLHVIEHIGLGRYGDTLDADGTRKACRELQRVLASGGILYVSTPIGRERVEFNAHRIHLPESIIDYYGGLQLLEFSCVTDEGEFIHNARLQDCRAFEYGLGLFRFTR